MPVADFRAATVGPAPGLASPSPQAPNLAAAPPLRNEADALIEEFETESAPTRPAVPVEPVVPPKMAAPAVQATALPAATHPVAASPPDRAAAEPKPLVDTQPLPLANAQPTATPERTAVPASESKIVAPSSPQPTDGWEQARAPIPPVTPAPPVAESKIVAPSPPKPAAGWKPARVPVPPATPAPPVAESKIVAPSPPKPAAGWKPTRVPIPPARPAPPVKPQPVPVLAPKKTAPVSRPQPVPTLIAKPQPAPVQKPRPSTVAAAKSNLAARKGPPAVVPPTLELPVLPPVKPLAPAADIPLRPATLFESSSAAPPKTSRRGGVAAAAALVVLSGFGGWFWMQTRVLDEVPLATAGPAAPVQSTSQAASSPGDGGRDQPAADPSPVPAPGDVRGQEAPPAETVGGTSGTAAPAPVTPSAATRPEDSPARDTNPIDVPVTAAVRTSGEEPALPVVGLPGRDEPRAVNSPANDSATTRRDDTPEPAPALPAATVESRTLQTPVGEAVSARAVAVAPPPPAPPDDRGVKAALGRYEAAYSRLDADAVGAVWPSVDRRGLARAFAGLAAQNVKLGRCEIAVAGGTATASCVGNTQWTPRVGREQLALRRWSFELKNAGADWIITSATVR